MILNSETPTYLKPMAKDEKPNLIQDSQLKEESAHLTIQSQQDDHNEKEYCPELRKRHHGNCSRVGNERQARTCSEKGMVRRNNEHLVIFLLLSQQNIPPKCSII